MPFKTTVSQEQIVVTTLAKLTGLSIPNPALNQGCLVNVTDDGSGSGAYFGLFLNFAIPPPVDGTNVLPTILGGDSRWMRMNIATMEIPPQTLVFHAAGRVLNDGTAEAGFNFTSSQVGPGEYRVNVGELPPGVVGDQLIFNVTAKVTASPGTFPPTATFDQDISPLDPRDFTIFVRDGTNMPQDAPFSFTVLIGALIPIP